jgi:hypothetical protein
MKFEGIENEENKIEGGNLKKKGGRETNMRKRKRNRGREVEVK